MTDNSMKKKSITSIFQHVSCWTTSSTQSFCIKWVCPKLDTPADDYKLFGMHVGAIVHCQKIKYNSREGILYFLK